MEDIRVPHKVGEALMSKDDRPADQAAACLGAPDSEPQKRTLLEEIVQATSQTDNQQPSLPPTLPPCQVGSPPVQELYTPEPPLPDPPTPEEVTDDSLVLYSKLELMILQDIERKMASNNLGLEELVAIVGRIADLKLTRIWTERLASHIAANPSILMNPNGGSRLLGKLQGMAVQSKKASRRDGRKGGGKPGDGLPD